MLSQKSLALVKYQSVRNLDAFALKRPLSQFLSPNGYSIF